MDIEEVRRILAENYAESIDSVSKISLDSAKKESLCVSEKTLYNYDKIIQQNFHGKDFPCSFDGIAVQGDWVNFIEFKNGKIDQKVKKGIRHKITEGIYYFEKMMMGGHFLSKHQIKTRFVLVYNFAANRKETKHQQELNDDIISLANRRKRNKAFENRFLGNVYDKQWKYVDEVRSLSAEAFLRDIGSYL